MIKYMVENGYSVSKIAFKLKKTKQEVKDIIQRNEYVLIKESFDEGKIDYICNLYKMGVSAKKLGEKYSIDKRRVQRWVNERGNLRTLEDSHRVKFFNYHKMDEIDSASKAYWFGFFMADAYNADFINTFIISLKEEDYGHLVKLANFIDLDANSVKRYMAESSGKKYPACKLRIYSKHFCHNMTKLGCVRAKSLIVKYPDILNKYDSHFIRGLFDGDGCLTRSGREWKWSIVSTKECLSEIKTRVNVDLNISKISDKNTYVLITGGNRKVKKICEWMYEESDELIRLDRKYEKYLKLKTQ